MITTPLVVPGFKPRQPTSGEKAVPRPARLGPAVEKTAFSCSAPVGRSPAFVTDKAIAGTSITSVPRVATAIHPAETTVTLTALATSSVGPLAETASPDAATTTIAHRRIADRLGRRRVR